MFHSQTPHGHNIFQIILIIRRWQRQACFFQLRRNKLTAPIHFSHSAMNIMRECWSTSFGGIPSALAFCKASQMSPATTQNPSMASWKKWTTNLKGWPCDGSALLGTTFVFPLHLLRSAVEIINFDQLLRLANQNNCWDYLKTSAVEIIWLLSTALAAAGGCGWGVPGPRPGPQPSLSHQPWTINILINSWIIRLFIMDIMY